MSRLDDLLNSAAERGQPRGADATLEGAREAAQADGAAAPIGWPSPRTLGLLSAAALLIVAVATAALVTGSDDTSNVATSPDGQVPASSGGPTSSAGSGGSRPCLTEPVNTDGELAFYATCSGASRTTGPYPIYRSDVPASIDEALRLSVAPLSDEEQDLGLTSVADFKLDTYFRASSKIDDDGFVSFQISEAGQLPAGGTAWTDNLTDDERDDLGRSIAATIFQFDEVQGIDGPSICLGGSECSDVLTREQWQSSLLADAGVVIYGGCSPAGAWTDPEMCTFEGLTDRRTGPARVTGVAADDTLVVRGGPGPDYPKLGDLAPDAEIGYTIAVDTADDGGTWRFVEGPNSSPGWVNEAFLNLLDGGESLVTIATVPSSVPKPLPTSGNTATTRPTTPGGTAPQPTPPPSPVTSNPTPTTGGSGPATTTPQSNDPYVLAGSFLDFASKPNAKNFAALPLAPNVQLGLGPDIIATRPAAQLASREGWKLEIDGYFRAGVGPFSALDILDKATDAQVTIGEHPHCASPPIPPPDEVRGLERISVQPPKGAYTSCNQWYTVDFFVNDDGQVQAITMDLYEP